MPLRIATMWRLLKPVTLAVLLLPMCSLTMSASAQVVRDTFNTNSVTAGFWDIDTDGGPTVTQGDGNLQVFFPADSTGDVPYARYLSLWTLRGDFDIQMDYKLLQWPALNGIRVGFALFGSNSDLPNTHRVSLGANEQLGQARESYDIDFTNGNQTRVGTTDSYGRLRMTRVAGVISGYYWDNKANAWVKMASELISNIDAIVSLQGWAGGDAFAGQPVKATFSDFRVNSGELVYPAGSTNFSVSATEVPGSAPITGVINLSSAAPAGGTTVKLKCTNPMASCPAQVTVPAGKTSQTFTISTSVVAGEIKGTISTTIGSVTFNYPLIVRPIHLQSLILSPNPISGGATTTAYVALEEPAPAGGMVVKFNSSNSARAKPTVTSITIPQGASVGTVTIQTTAVKNSSAVAIRATANGATLSSTLTVDN